MSEFKPIESNRSPVMRQRAEDYLLVMLLCFAGSVSLTRLFLELTAYPQLGSGEFHIAHVLWGGFSLYFACLLPLIFANRWALFWSSAFAGIGIGLFIDEVGKFITSTNDYFYPAAAPIVYAIFLLSVLVLIFIRNSQKKRDSRSRFYDVLQAVEEILDGDLSLSEFEALMVSLEEISRDPSDPTLSALAVTLMEKLHQREFQLVDEIDTPLKIFVRKFEYFEMNYLTRRRMRAVISGGLIAWGIWAIGYPLSVIMKLRLPQEFHHFLEGLVSNQLIRGYPGLTWFQIRIGLEGGVGILILISGILLLLGFDRSGIPLAIGSMLISLTIINLLIFYFDQFSTIIFAIIQFILLIFLIRFRNRFQRSMPTPHINQK